MKKYLAFALLALAVTGGVVAYTSMHNPAERVADCSGNGC